MGLAATRKSIGTDSSIGQLGKAHCEDEMSSGPGGDSNDPSRLLVKEFEQSKQCFDGEAQAIVELKSKHAALSGEELWNLKRKFETWKTDFKVRLGEAKAKIQRPGNSQEEIRNLKLKFKAWKKDFKLQLRDAKSKVYKPETEGIRRKWNDLVAARKRFGVR